MSVPHNTVQASFEPRTLVRRLRIFDWVYAVAPPEVSRELGQLYGDQFLNPPATPMLIIDQHGEVHPLPFGIKSAGDLQEALEPFLNLGT